MQDTLAGTPDLDKNLLEVMKAIESVPKDGRNEFHRYGYATITYVLRAVRGKVTKSA